MILERSPRYVLVHEEFVRITYNQYADGNDVLKEFDRLRQQASNDVVLIDDLPPQLPEGLSYDRSLAVCGANYEEFIELIKRS